MVLFCQLSSVTVYSFIFISIIIIIVFIFKYSVFFCFLLLSYCKLMRLALANLLLEQLLAVHPFNQLFIDISQKLIFFKIIFVNCATKM